MPHFPFRFPKTMHISRGWYSSTVESTHSLECNNMETKHVNCSIVSAIRLQRKMFPCIHFRFRFHSQNACKLTSKRLCFCQHTLTTSGKSWTTSRTIFDGATPSAQTFHNTFITQEEFSRQRPWTVAIATKAAGEVRKRLSL